MPEIVSESKTWRFLMHGPYFWLKAVTPKDCCSHSPVEDLPPIKTIQRLKVAYVNKERAAQYEENRFLRQVENDKEQAIADKVHKIVCGSLARLKLIVVHLLWPPRRFMNSPALNLSFKPNSSVFSWY